MALTLKKSLAVLAGVLAVSPSFAVVLTDGGSSVTLNDAGLSGSTALISNWNLNTGGDQLWDHSWFFRTQTGPAVRVNSLAQVSTQSLGANAHRVTFGNADFQIDMTFSLFGGNGSASIAEQIRVRNIGANPLNIVLYRYSDFDLAGTVGNDTVTRTNSSTMTQVDGAWSLVSSAVPVPMFTQLGTGFLGTITSGANLDTAAGAGIGASATPSDAAFAMQFMHQLGVGGQAVMSTDQVLRVVPEPGSMIALGLGAAALVARRRRK